MRIPATAFLDDRGSERCQAAEARRVGVHVAKRYGCIAVVEKPEVPQTTPVGFLEPLEVALKEVSAFDCLNDSRLAVLMRSEDVGRSDENASCHCAVTAGPSMPVP